MVFEVTKEHWEYQLQGKLVFEDGIKINNGNHVISFEDFIKSWGFKAGDSVIVGIERKEVK